jgi:hypothetical protein
VKWWLSRGGTGAAIFKRKIRYILTPPLFILIDGFLFLLARFFRWRDCDGGDSTGELELDMTEGTKDGSLVLSLQPERWGIF